MNDNQPLRLGQIAFINSWPVYYGFTLESCIPEMKLVIETPSVLNEMLHNKQIDLSAISAAEYALHFQEYKLIPDLSISSLGEVNSVCWYSRIPFSELHEKKFLVTQDSLTSVWLSKILFQELYGISPDFFPGKIDQNTFSNKLWDGFLVIGDSALRLQNQKNPFLYSMDLGKAWYDLTQKPFVFAVWSIRKDSLETYPLAIKKVIKMLYESKQQGLQSLDILSHRAEETLNIPYNACVEYFQHLHYGLSPLYKEGMELFFNYLYKYSLIPYPVKVEFWQE